MVRLVLWTVSLILILSYGSTTVSAGANGTEAYSGVVADSDGNSYYVGNTSGSLAETVGGANDVIIAKYNSSGSLQWLKQLGSVTMGAASSGADYAKGIAVDGSGNIFITGYTEGSLGETNGGSADAFIAKLNPSGILQWVKQLGSATMGSASSGTEVGAGIALDVSGNIYISGYTTGSLGEANAGSLDVFITKFNSSGVKQWVKQLGSTTMGSAASGYDHTTGITLDSSGNIYVSGSSRGNLGETNGGNEDAFVVKFNSSGVKQWISQLGSTTMGSASAGDDQANGISVDSSGNVYIAGTTMGSLGETNALYSDAFIAKFNSSGIKQWVSQLGAVTMGSAANGYDYAYDISLDGSGQYLYFGEYTTGYLGEAGAFSDAYIAKFNSSGVKQWVSQLGTTTMGSAANGYDYGLGIALDGSGNYLRLVAGQMEALVAVMVVFSMLLLASLIHREPCSG